MQMNSISTNVVTLITQLWIKSIYWLPSKYIMEIKTIKLKYISLLTD